MRSKGIPAAVHRPDHGESKEGAVRFSAMASSKDSLKSRRNEYLSVALRYPAALPDSCSCPPDYNLFPKHNRHQLPNGSKKYSNGFNVAVVKSTLMDIP